MCVSLTNSLVEIECREKVLSHRQRLRLLSLLFVILGEKISTQIGSENLQKKFKVGIFVFYLLIKSILNKK